MEATPSNDWKPRIKVSKEAKTIAARVVKLGDAEPRLDGNLARNTARNSLDAYFHAFD
jgi:hypothetical protein